MAEREQEMAELRAQLADARAAAAGAASVGSPGADSRLTTSALLNRLHTMEEALAARDKELAAAKAAAAASAQGSAAAGVTSPTSDALVPVSALTAARREAAAAAQQADAWRDTVLPLVPGAQGPADVAAALRTLAELEAGLQVGAGRPGRLGVAPYGWLAMKPSRSLTVCCVAEAWGGAADSGTAVLWLLTPLYAVPAVPG